MSDGFKIQLTSNAAAITATLEEFPEKMARAIVKTMDKENEETVGVIAREKLSQRGPTTLGVVSNRLRLSVRKTSALVSGVDVVSSIGSNVKYAAAHEFGFTGVVQVKAHKRRIIAHDRYRKHGRGFIKTQSGIPGTIRAHSMKMNLPERSYIRSTLQERAPRYTEALSKGIEAAWGGAS